MFRKLRYFYWVVRELVRLYTRSLGFGLLLGLSVAFVIWKGSPFIRSRWLAPTRRVGIVGEFTPTTLPVSIQKQISRGLTSIGPDGKALPDLATSWEATDSGKVYVFHLTDDALWHNNKQFSSGDINYNIRSVTFFQTNDTTLKASLQSPYSPLPTLLAKPIFSSGLSGVGPYKVVSIQLKGDAVQFLKLTPVTGTQNPSLEYRFYRTEALAVLGYQMGEVDELEDITNGSLANKIGQATITEKPMYSRIVTLFFNLDDQLMKEKSFRQALGYALPIFPYERAYSPLSKNSWAYTDKVRHFADDKEQAVRLLTQAFGASSSASLVITTFSPYVDTAREIAQSWNDIGIQTDIKVENALPPTYQVLLSAQDIPPDPDQYPFWHSTQSQSNVTHYTNVKIDKLLEDGRQETDSDERVKIYADFQRRLVDDAPALFLYYPTYYTIVRK